MKIHINKNIGTLLKILLLPALAAAIFIFAAQGAYAISLTTSLIDPDSDTRVQLDWTSVAGASTYRLSRAVGTSTGAAMLVKDFAVDTALDLTFIDSGLQPQTLYTYIISAYSDTASAIKIDEITAPVTTTKMIAPYEARSVFDINSRQVTLNWSASKMAAQCEINATVAGNTTTTMGSNATSYTTAPLSGGNEVSYTIKSIGTGPLESDISEPIAVLPIQPPTISIDTIHYYSGVTWGDYPQIGLFQLERSLWDTTLSKWNAWVPVSTFLSGTGFNDAQGVSGKYRYRLAARSGSGYSGYSNITQSTSVAAPPNNLVLNMADSHTINLSWVNAPGNSLPVTIRRQIGEGSDSIIEDSLSSLTTSYTDSIIVVPGLIYTYTVGYEYAANKYIVTTAKISATLPAAPSLLRANVVSSSAVTLNWTDNSNNETGFRIERVTDPGIYTQIATVAAITATYVDTSVSSGHSYLYRVCSYNALGNSPYTNEVYVAAWDSVAPANLTVVAYSATRLDLSWSYTGTESYNTVIERKTGTDGTWSTIYTTALGALKYSDTGLMPNTRYFYRIRKSMGTGSTGLSYPNDEIGIGAYTNLGNLTLTGIAAANNTIYLSWTGNSGTADVVIERKMPNGSFSALNTVSYVTSGWSDTTGLVPSASYTYRIKARTSTNESVYSNIITVQNLYLDAPSLLTVTVTTNSAVELNWRDNSTDETGFEVWRYIYGSGTYTLYATVDKNITTYTDNTIQKGVQYNYMVRAYVASGTLYSPYSNSASIGAGLINPPSNITYAYVSSTQVLLSWTDTSDNENGFKVEWKIGSDGVWNVLSWLNPNVTAYNVTNLNPYTKYYFRVRAYSSSGNSDSLSDEILVSTAIPAAPSNVVATALSATQIKITWKDNSDSEDVFRILRKPSNAYYFDVLAEIGKNNTVYTDSNLIAGMRYSYKVVSYNSTGSSESSVADAKTNTKATFSDLKSVSWARDAIENLAGMGIMKGVTATLYKPGNTVTKADFTAMVVRAFKLDTTPVGSLADVKSNKWYYNEIMIAENLGIISGDASNKFYPEKAITREEIAVILFKVKQISPKPLTIHNNSVLEKFSDKNKITPSALASLATIVGEGIMEGLPGNAIGPSVTATRAQAAVLLYRTMNK